MKVAVAQLGARRHYVVPTTLNECGMLSRFYTDLYVKDWPFGKLLRNMARVIEVGGVNRMAARYDTDLEADRVTSYPAFGLMYKLFARCSRSQTELTRTWLWGGQRFCELVARDELGDTDTVYAYTSAAKELFEVAKSAGKRCVLDQATAPKLYEDNLVNEQIQRYPGWVDGPIKDDYAAAYTARQQREWELADLIVCGSTFVRESIGRLGGPVEKTVVVPLGLRTIPQNYPHHSNGRTGSLHVLFVGDDAIRKGIGDFVEAMRLAGSEQFKGRVVGNVKLSDYGRRKASEVVELIGAIPRSEMAAQYHWADLFVLPSVSDTFGLVILEAMAHGLPVIATKNTGGPDILRDGVDGFIVPVMAPEAIGDCLVRFARNPKLLQEMSRNSFDRCHLFGMEAYALKLAGLLERCPERGVNVTD